MYIFFIHLLTLLIYFIMEKKILTNEQMEQFINDNMDKVPARSLTKFNEMTTEKERLSRRLEDTRSHRQDIQNASRQEKINIIKDIVSVIYVTRISRFVVRLEFHNRYTGEVRSWSVNTRSFKLFDMTVKMRPMLIDSSR